MLGGRDEFGIPKVVEIDESLFFRAKYNRGNHTIGQWYVGGVERGSKKVFLVPVASRNTATLLQVIQDHVLPGSIVITDQWRAYDAALRQITGMEHRTVNHSINFVNPNDPSSHTQQIEGFWSHSKGDIRSRQGIKQDEHYEYLLQFIWTYQIPKKQRINQLLLLFRINQ
jgi:transposase-like protein